MKLSFFLKENKGSKLVPGLWAMILPLMYRNYFIKALFFTFFSLESSLFVITIILIVYLFDSSTLACIFFFISVKWILW